VYKIQPHTITYYIKPDGGTLCPEMPCFTFQEYAENGTLNLELDSTFIFLPGIHSLSSDFVAANISNLIMSGLELTSYPQAHVQSNQHVEIHKLGCLSQVNPAIPPVHYRCHCPTDTRYRQERKAH